MKRCHRAQATLKAELRTFELLDEYSTIETEPHFVYRGFELFRDRTKLQAQG